MNHIVSVTLIPVSGINKPLDKEIFLENFIDKAEEILDTLPVGCAIEIVYDDIHIDSKGMIDNVKHCTCTIRQRSRGDFHKVFSTNPYVNRIVTSCYKTLNKPALQASGPCWN